MLTAALPLNGQTPEYDLLLRGGHVIDAKNGVDAVRDVAIRDGKIALVAAKIDPTRALKVVNVTGLYVTPGLVDIHVHVYAGTGEARSYAGDNSLYPDGYTFRAGVTTVADAGCAGWRNFEDFKQRVIDRSRTRVLAFLNIVGNGMRGAKYENDLTDMQAKPTAEMALQHKGLIIGIKTAHFAGPEWTPVEQAVEAGTIAAIPVMVDFGTNRKERPMSELVTKRLRPGDIYTHAYSGLRNEQDETGHVNPAMIEARKRGVIFDVGHGGGSFAWRIAVPAIKQGFLPDSISTDLHTGSMNSGMKDIDNVMSKFLAMGLSDPCTWSRKPHGIRRAKSIAKIWAIFPQAQAPTLPCCVWNEVASGIPTCTVRACRAISKLVCELTLRDGKVVWDLNGITRPDWTTLPRDYKQIRRRPLGRDHARRRVRPVAQP